MSAWRCSHPQCGRALLPYTAYRHQTTRQVYCAPHAKSYNAGYGSEVVVPSTPDDWNEGDPAWPDTCLACNEPYKAPAFDKSRYFCTDGFHRCRLCTWENGRLVKRCLDCCEAFYRDNILGLD